MTWQDNADCKGADSDLFFPKEITVEHLQDVKRRYCDVCPVRRECLEAALSDRSTSGIHGGMSFPLVGPIPYAMELLHLEGWDWTQIGEHFGTTRHSASAWVSGAYRQAERNAEEGTQYMSRRVVRSERLSGLRITRPLAQRHPADLTELIVRRVTDGLSYEEVAAELDMSYQAVGQRFRRARKKTG